MAVAEAAFPARFDMGRVATRTFSVIGHNIVTFGLLSLIPAVPAALMVWGQTRLMVGVLGTPHVFDGAAMGTLGIAALAYGIGMLVLQAAIVHGTIVYLNGKPASFRDCLNTGLKNFFPLLLIGLLEALGILGGLILLIIPGFIFAVMWSMAVPVRVAEHTGIRASLGRSRVLTRGHRWAIVGLFVCYIIVQGIVAASLGTISTAPFSFTPANTPDALTAASAARGNWQNILGSAIAAMINVVVAAAGIASIYYELRVIKEGIGPEALASVFD